MFDFSPSFIAQLSMQLCPLLVRVAWRLCRWKRDTWSYFLSQVTVSRLFGLFKFVLQVLEFHWSLWQGRPLDSSAHLTQLFPTRCPHSLLFASFFEKTLVTKVISLCSASADDAPFIAVCYYYSRRIIIFSPTFFAWDWCIDTLDCFYLHVHVYLYIEICCKKGTQLVNFFWLCFAKTIILFSKRLLVFHSHLLPV